MGPKFSTKRVATVVVVLIAGYIGFNLAGVLAAADASYDGDADAAIVLGLSLIHI